MEIYLTHLNVILNKLITLCQAKIGQLKFCRESLIIIKQVGKLRFCATFQSPLETTVDLIKIKLLIKF